MKKIAPALALAIAGLTLLPATAAVAAPWDGNDITYDLGDWELYSNAFYLEDVDLVFPDTSTEYTDIWDGAAQTSISSASLGLTSQSVGCPSDADVDQSIDPATGDLVLTCTVTDTPFVDADLSIVMEIRIYQGSDLIRSSMAITNTSGVDATIDSVEYYTDFGSTGELFDYQNQDDLVLAVPAAENSDFAATLNSVDAQWIVHIESDDAPGGIIIGLGGSDAPGIWTETDGDEYYYELGSFTIPAGQTRYTATFLNWHPQSLIDGDYDNGGSDPDLLETSAAAIVSSMSEFASFSGRLAAGLPAGAEVVNWGAIAAAPAPELAATGTTDAAALTAGGAAAVLLLLGATLFAVSRRQRVRPTA